MLLQFDFGGGAPGGQPPVILVAVAVAVVVVVALVLLGEARVERRSHGLVAVLMGESLARALERALVEINADGRRVVFVLRESWSTAATFGNRWRRCPAPAA